MHRRSLPGGALRPYRSPLRSPSPHGPDHGSPAAAHPPAPDPAVTAPLDAKARLGLTLIAGGAVANIYYNQPLLGLIVAEFGDRAALWVPTTALVGYGLGIVGLVPLGDALPRRALIVGQCLGLALACSPWASRRTSPASRSPIWWSACCPARPSRRSRSRPSSPRTRAAGGSSARS